MKRNYDDSLSRISYNLHRIRSGRPLRTIAKMIDTTAGQLCRIENQQHMPSAGYLEHIAKGLGEKVETFYKPIPKKRKRKSKVS